MNLFSQLMRELAMWKQYPKDRFRWLFWKKTALDTAMFQVQDRNYPYFIHPYNRTWRNERAIEIPVVWEYVCNAKEPHTILEIGNVLSHYFDIRHCVIDKWEKCRYYGNVVNHDLLSWEPERLSWEPERQFQLIISISTIEHVGWDDKPKRPEAVVEAFAKIERLLSFGGTALVTVPIGQNPILDQWLCAGKLPFSEMFFLKRISQLNEWIEIGQETALKCSYGSPFPAANAVAFLFLHKNHNNVA